jgi:hypothetical protein
LPEPTPNNGETAASARDDEGVATETVVPLDHSLVPPTRAMQTPDFFASLNEQFESFSNWSAVNLHSNPSGCPIMVDMSPPDVFQSQAAIPIIGSRVGSRDSIKIRIPYFRWFGPTGIVPGFTRVLVDLRKAGSEKSASTTSPPTHTIYPATSNFQMNPSSRGTHQLQSEEQPESLLFDIDDEMVPNIEILEHLLMIFFDYFGSHFPFYQKDRFMDSVRSKSVPAVLLNSMCALASRFSHHPHIRREPIYLCGEIFGDKAKQLIVVLLAVPSYDLVASLLMLSWCEFGCNRDVGFWMYTGMAIRMAQDLGMHKGSEERVRSEKVTPPESNFPGGIEQPRENGDYGRVDDEESSMQLNLFWSIYFIDRIISLGKTWPCYKWFLFLLKFNIQALVDL